MDILRSVVNFTDPGLDYCLLDTIHDLINFVKNAPAALLIIKNSPNWTERLLSGLIKHEHLSIIKWVPSLLVIAIGFKKWCTFVGGTLVFVLKESPWLSHPVQVGMRAVAGASILMAFDSITDKLTQFHPLAPPVAIAVCSTYKLWRRFIPVPSLAMSVHQMIRDFILAPEMRRLNAQKLNLSQGFITKGSRDLEFAYSPLESNSMIRLLKLEVQLSTKPMVVCEIITTEITHAPPYDAISYLWGSPNQTHSLEVGRESTQQIGITENATKALRLVTPREGVRYIWIDSVCINQKSSSEKSQQVPRMGKIYRRAKEVIICLGDSEDAEETVDFLNEFTWAYSHKRGEHSLAYALYAGNDYSLPLRLSLPAFEERKWKLWENVLRNDYFTRIWIIQECVLASKITVFLGGIPFDWLTLTLPTLVTSATPFLNESTQRTTIEAGQLAMICGLHNRLRQNKLPPFVELVILSLSQQATDPRDKVYGMLGLIQGGEELPVRVDYELETYQVTVDFISYALQSGSFAPLACSGLSQQTNREISDSLPTWVLNLQTYSSERAILTTLQYHEGDYSAGQSQPPEFSIDSERRQLKLTGILLDTVLSHSTSPDVEKHIDSLIQLRNKTGGASLSHDFFNEMMSVIEFFESQDLAMLEVGSENRKLSFWRTVTDNFNREKMSDQELLNVTESLELLSGTVIPEALRLSKQTNSGISPYIPSNTSGQEVWMDEKENDVNIAPKTDHESDDDVTISPRPELNDVMAAQLKFITEYGLFNAPKFSAPSMSKNNARFDLNVIAMLYLTLLMRMFAISEKGYFLLAPRLTQKGDLIVIFHGAPAPHILRPSGDGQGGYFLVGEAYVDGVMHGEAMLEEAEGKWFTIR